MPRLAAITSSVSDGEVENQTHRLVERELPSTPFGKDRLKMVCMLFLRQLQDGGFILIASL